MREIARAVYEQGGVLATRLFDQPECRTILTRLQQDSNWQAALVDDLAEGKVRNKPRDRIAQTNSLTTLPDLCDRFCQAIASHLLPHLRQFYRSTAHTLVDLAVVRYAEGGMYRLHVDNEGPSSYRRFTVVCYLNDDLVGGETDFPEVDVRVKPQAGMAIGFPAEYRHASLPVQSGWKYVLVCWVMGPSRWI